MSKFEYKEGDEFELSGNEILTKAGEVLAAGGTYTLKGSILKITGLPKEESKKAEEKKPEEKKAEEPKAAEESKDDEKKSTRGSKPKAETSDDKE